MTTTQAPTSHLTGYWQRWRSTPSSVVYLIACLALGVVSFTVLITLVSLGLGTLVLVVGFAILALALFTADGFAAAERAMIEITGRPAIPRPPRRWRPSEGGTAARVRSALANPHRWVALVHGTLVAFPIGLLFGTLAIIWASLAVGGLTAPIWYAVVPDTGYVWGNDVVRFMPVLSPLGGIGTEILLQVLTGAVFALTLPWAVTGMVGVKYGIMRGMLGRWESDDLRQEVVSLSASRGAAVQAEDYSVRRLERDLHDGPQQRLMRLQMDLATLERRIEDDPEQARTLIAEARGHGQAVLDELRALVGGMAPPLLQDRGLGPALEALAARNPIPATEEIHLGPQDQLPSEVERSAYFIVAELLANTVKHSGATQVKVRAFRHSPGPGLDELVVQVGDDGNGGAAITPGHGLHGLQERVAGLRGEFWVESPAGGPTLITAALPLR